MGPAEVSGRLGPGSGAFAGAADDPAAAGRRAASTSAIAASPFANTAAGLIRPGSPALGPGVFALAVAAAMPSSHSAPNARGADLPPRGDRPPAPAGGPAAAPARADNQQASECADAERRASGVDGASSGAGRPPANSWLGVLPDRRQQEEEEDGNAPAGASPRSVASLGELRSYPIPEEEPEVAAGPAEGAAHANVEADGVGQAAQQQQWAAAEGKLRDKEAGQKPAGGGETVLDCDGSGAVQRLSGKGVVGLRAHAAH